MPALATVQDYVNAARVLLQDQDNAPYRYPDEDLVDALNFSLLDALTLRPDLFLTGDPQSFTAVDTTPVNIDLRYRTAILYYICGHAQLRDDENTQDTRASGFFAKFTGRLTSLG